MNRTFHAVLHILGTIGGVWYIAHYLNPNIGADFAVGISIVFSLFVGRMVIDGYDLMHRSSLWSRFAVASMWGAIPGAAFALAAGWGGNQIFPTWPIPQWLFYLAGSAVADGLGTIIIPKSAWKIYPDARPR
jgi:hypothetical protein